MPDGTRDHDTKDVRIMIWDLKVGTYVSSDTTGYQSRKYDYLFMIIIID